MSEKEHNVYLDESFEGLDYGKEHNGFTLIDEIAIQNILEKGRERTYLTMKAMGLTDANSSKEYWDAIGKKYKKEPQCKTTELS